MENFKIFIGYNIKSYNENFIMFKFSAVSQIWKKYIQKLNAWDLSLIVLSTLIFIINF